jgi:uncharacterized protein YgbK (DUF1537 family)
MILVIADDLTGAAEIAGIGWRHGLSVEILRGDESASRADLVVYDTDSRDCPPREAARRVRAVLAKFRRRQPALIYKKVDSVLRGNVRAEIEAALMALNLSRCVLAPANPAAQRTIRNGRYFIAGQPIDQTGFRYDPGHPRITADVVTLLGKGRLPLTVAKPARRTLPDGVIVAAASITRDVQRWATHASADTFAAGGADFFTALLKQRGHRLQSRRAPQRNDDRPLLLVSGSMANTSLELLQRWAGEGKPVLLMPCEVYTGPGACRSGCAVWQRRIIAALKTHPQVAVGIGQPALTAPTDRLRLGRLLTGVVRGALRETPPGQICIEGGATAALLIQRLGWERLTVAGEFATGVVAVRPRDRRAPLLVFKPGSYLWPPTVFDSSPAKARL